MPSDRKQINVRVDGATEVLMRRLIVSVSAGIGLVVNQSDLFRLGLHELAKKYPPPAEDPPPVPSPAPESKRRKPSTAPFPPSTPKSKRRNRGA